MDNIHYIPWLKNKKPSITCISSFVEPRPKMMMMIVGHECKRENVCVGGFGGMKGC
jgi:hypothetical protein